MGIRDALPLATAVLIADPLPSAESAVSLETSPGMKAAHPGSALPVALPSLPAYPSEVEAECLTLEDLLLAEPRLLLPGGAVEALRVYELPLALEACCDRLEEFRFPLTLEDTNRELERYVEAVALLQLYQSTFPEEFAASVAERSSVNGGHSGAEVEFFHLIHERLFPLEMLLDDVLDEERYSFIPVEPLGIDQWDQPFEDFDLGWQLLFLLTGEGELDVVEVDDETHAQLARLLSTISAGQVDAQVMERLAAQVGGPLEGLLDAIRMIDHNTGTVWLDITYECGCYDADWSAETLRVLADEYRQARSILNRVDRLLSWLTDDPVQHFQEAIDLWNRTRALTPTE